MGDGVEHGVNNFSLTDLLWAVSSGVFAQYVFQNTPGSPYVRATAGGFVFIAGAVGKAIGSQISNTINPHHTNGISVIQQFTYRSLICKSNSFRNKY